MHLRLAVLGLGVSIVVSCKMGINSTGSVQPELTRKGFFLPTRVRCLVREECKMK